MKRSLKRNGFTLPEVVISSLLVGVVLVAAMNTLGSVLITRRNAVALQIGPSLATDLMSEILQKAYTDPEQPNASLGPNSGEGTSTRNAFDDIDDYHGWSTTNPVRSDGTSLAYGGGWRREVIVTHVNVNSLTTSSSSTGLKQITVTVTSPEGETTMQEALRSFAGCLERTPSQEQTYVSGAQILLQTSDLATDVIVGTPIKNHGINQ